MTEQTATDQTQTKAVRDVGVVIRESESNRPVIEAIEADNPGCTVMHTPGLVRITAPGRIVINRETVEEKVGREWETHEFQMAIVSYFGNIREWDDDEIVIARDH
ncbi:MmoB/DmpM family protein [Janibacter limosus]|uniref:MmoB/DmpM family protein n=1 Tax=Janibacter limosus TaxID=53458 RepID=UPI0035D86BCA|nr:MmoB/DmpM family protein [Janibacter limosus]